MKVRLFVAATLVAALATLMPPAGAQQQGAIADRLSLDTGVVQIDGKPGGVSADRFKLINRTETAVTVRAMVEDLSTDSNGGVVAAPRLSGLQSAAAWVSVASKEIEVPANGIQTVDVTITVPKKVAPGGYYASVTFDRDDRSPPDSRLAHAILVRIAGAGAAPAARVVSFDMKAPSYSGQVEMKITLQNEGTVHAIGSGRIDVDDTFGKRIAQLAVPTVVVMPQHQRIVRIVYQSPPVAGRLRATVVMSFDGKDTSASDTGFVLIWWLVAALTAVVVLFALALARLAGLVGPKAAARRAGRAPAAGPAPVAVSASGMATGTSSPFPPRSSDPPQQAPVTPAPLPGSPPASGSQRLGMPPLVPPIAPAGEPVSSGDSARSRPSAPVPDEAFWGPDDDDVPAPRVRDEPEIEPVEVAAVIPAGASTWALDDLRDDEDEADDATDDDDDLDEKGELDGVDTVRPVGAFGLELDDNDDLELELGGDDELEPFPDKHVDAGSESAGEEDDSGDEPDTAWPSEPAAAMPSSKSARPVPVVLPGGLPGGRRAASPTADPTEPDDEQSPIRPPLRPADPDPRQSRIADLPPLRVPASLPESNWGPAPSTQPLDRPTGGSAMALRRADVALRMIGGKTGETGAILDSGLDLLYSVRADPDVVARVEEVYEETRNRRKLGPLALALFAVDSRKAPEALVDSFATASKMIAERIRRAILACDPVDIRAHRDLIRALPQGRRDQLGL